MASIGRVSDGTHPVSVPLEILAYLSVAPTQLCLPIESSISVRPRNPPFDDRSIPPQSGRRPSIRVEPNVPPKAEVSATPPPREGSMHSMQTHRHPSSAPSLCPLSPTYAQCPSSSLVNNSQGLLAYKGPGNDKLTMIDPDDDELYYPCGNFSFEKVSGCNGSDYEMEWFHFVCVGIGPRARLSIGPATTLNPQLNVIIFYIKYNTRWNLFGWQVECC